MRLTFLILFLQPAKARVNSLARCASKVAVIIKILDFVSRRNAWRTGNIIAAETVNSAFDSARAGGERGPRLAMRAQSESWRRGTASRPALLLMSRLAMRCIHTPRKAIYGRSQAQTA
ncbi:hypothetical protein KCP78_07095 [Salmonella enterica subsp. enterica]|nr:hypothetical protein KCP78_07095 [Salmonella enterica subsp. enterica]